METLKAVIKNLKYIIYEISTVWTISVIAYWVLTLIIILVAFIEDDFFIALAKELTRMDAIITTMPAILTFATAKWLNIIKK